MPSDDPETEHWRGLMHRRFRIFLLGGPLLFLLPMLFGLIGLDAAIISGAGLFAYVWLGGALVLLAVWTFRFVVTLIAYGAGSPLEIRAMLTSVGGVSVAVIVLIGLLLVR